MTSGKKKTEKPHLLRRAAKAFMRVTVTLAVATGAIVAVAIGSQELNRRADAMPSPDAAPLTPVVTAPIALAAGYEVTRSFVGQIEAKRTAVISFELSGRLNEILVDEGDTVSMGQHIATLDTRLLDAEREQLEASRTALEAQLRFAERTLERRSQLSNQGFASQSALDEAVSRSTELKARIAETEASLLSNAIQTKKSRVYASFDGRVTERFVDGGESVAPGLGLVEIIESSAPHLRVGVPLDVTEALLASATVVIAGAEHDAALITLRPDVDPITRTRTAIFEVADGIGLTFGQTAHLRLGDTAQAEGIWVPLTTLKEGLRGQWSLLVVDAENTVRALSVQVLHTHGDRVFVRGAFPAGVQLITSGPQRVTVGQSVAPQPAS